MHDAIWEDARRRLRECLPAKDYETWIGPLRATQGADEELTLEVPSAFGLDWIRAHLWDRLAASVGEAAGHPVALKLVVNRGLGAPAPVRRPVRRAEPETGPWTRLLSPSAGLYTSPQSPQGLMAARANWSNCSARELVK